MSKFPPKKEENVIIKKREKLNWSEYQKAIFRNIASDPDHLIVEALAGSSKTTSIVEGLRYAPKGKKILVLAFNKLIAEELKSRCSGNVEVSTFHSLGYRAIRLRFGNVLVDDYKTINILSDLADKEDKCLLESLKQAVDYCKYSLLDTPSKIEEMINKFDIDICDLEMKEFIDIVIKTLSLSKKDTAKIDFADMCWFPFAYNLNLGKFCIISIDEVQDLNLSQLTMAKKALAPDGKLILVGDLNQAIYGWRCADSSIFESVKNNPKTKTLTLPISYRCPTKILDLVRPWVPDILAKPDAIEGEIFDISLNKLYDEAKPGCLILSRTNAPLIKICMLFIKNNKKANILGRDIGNGLIWVIKHSKKKNIISFLKWLHIWKNNELIKLQKKNLSTDNLLDKYECLLSICEDVNSIEAAINKITEIFNDSDEKNIITLSTVHRAKGKERNDVFILRWTFTTWIEAFDITKHPNEECNIVYVAISRSKHKLFIVKK